MKDGCEGIEVGRSVSECGAMISEVGCRSAIHLLEIQLLDLPIDVC